MSRKPYVRPISRTGWWLKNSRYLHYMSHELPCIFVAALAIYVLCALSKVASGPEAYAAFVSALQSPMGIGLSIALLFITLYNSMGWFKVTPKALPIQIGEEFLDGKYVVIAHYVVWIVTSIIVLYVAGVL